MDYLRTSGWGGDRCGAWCQCLLELSPIWEVPEPGHRNYTRPLCFLSFRRQAPRSHPWQAHDPGNCQPFVFCFSILTFFVSMWICYFFAFFFVMHLSDWLLWFIYIICRFDRGCHFVTQFTCETRKNKMRLLVVSVWFLSRVMLIAENMGKSKIGNIVGSCWYSSTSSNSFCLWALFCIW